MFSFVLSVLPFVGNSPVIRKALKKQKLNNAYKMQNKELSMLSILEQRASQERKRSYEERYKHMNGTW